MNNDNMNNDLNLFFENINDFTVNVFRSLPENSHLLTLWSEFRSFLNPENYQFPEAQKFISTIDSESNDFSTKKSSHAQKSLSEIGYDIPKDCFQFSHPIISSGRYTMDKGDGSYDDHQKKSNNSTQSSNPLITPNSTSTYRSFQEHNSGKDKLINLSREDIKIQNDMKLENIGYNNKFVISDKQDHSKDEFILPNTNLFQDSRNDYEIEFQQREYKYTNNGGSFQISDLDFGKIHKKEIHFHNGNTQKDYEKSKTIKGEIGGTEAKILTETSSLPNFSFPTVLEFITKIVDKSHISNLSSLENLYVFQRKDNQNSFYYCLVLTYFLYLLADNTTSFWLSSLYERIVMFKAKLAYYKNEEQLYESLTNGLKALIKEKSTKPGQLRPLQNLFLKLFLEDKNFQDGLIVTMKEFLIAQLESLDEKSCQSVLGLSTSQLGDQIENIRISNNTPKEGILSFLPEILEGDVEILYVTQNKFERKIFKQKEELNEKSILSLICQKITVEAENFYALGSRDHAEMFVTLNKEQQIKEAQKKLKDTVYYSLDSDVGELNSAEIIQKRNLNDNNFYPSKEDKKIENKTLGLQRFEKKQVLFNTNFLLNKIKDVVAIMDDHSNKLLSLAKAKECSILNKIRQNQNLKTEAATNLPTMRYASPLTTLPNQPISNVDTSASSNLNKQFCFNFGPTSDKNYYPISGNPHLHFLPHIEEIPDSQRTKPTVSKPNQNFPPVNELLAKLCRGALDKGLLQPPSPIIVPLPVRTFSSPESKKHLNQRNYITSRGKTNISPLKVILANVPEFHNSPEIKNSEKADQVFTCLTPKNTGQENKENRENILLNMRSPLKKIVVYSHQKDTIIDNVEKEAVVLNEFIKNSPHNSPDLHKLILEDHTYTRVCKKD